MSNFRTFLSAILGGIALSLGGAAYLSLYNDSFFLASAMFSIGVLAVLTFELDIFTDKASKFISTQPRRLDQEVLALLIVALGNTIGAIGCGLLCGFFMNEAATAVYAAKTAEPFILTFVRAVFCGMLMYIACHGYRRQGGGFSGCAIVVASVTTFGICGFEHFVADVFYCTARLSFGYKSFAFLGLILLGNFIGAMLFSWLYELKKNGRKHHHHHHHHHS
ncbi:MAG: formate/nitrite transporter family protein [Clostridia bacterium]|nr:formate/nitrite transporter family protein [Clostridia bacterium]